MLMLVVTSDQLFVVSMRCPDFVFSWAPGVQTSISLQLHNPRSFPSGWVMHGLVTLTPLNFSLGMCQDADRMCIVESNDARILSPQAELSRHWKKTHQGSFFLK